MKPTHFDVDDESFDRSLEMVAYNRSGIRTLEFYTSLETYDKLGPPPTQALLEFAKFLLEQDIIEHKSNVSTDYDDEVS